MSGVVGAADAAGVEDLLAEHLREPDGEAGVLAAEPLVVLFEVGQVREQGLPAGRGGGGACAGGGGAGVDPGAQVVVAVKEGPVDALLTEQDQVFQQFNG